MIITCQKNSLILTTNMFIRKSEESEFFECAWKTVDYVLYKNIMYNKYASIILSDVILFLNTWTWVDMVW